MLLIRLQLLPPASRGSKQDKAWVGTTQWAHKVNYSLCILKTDDKSHLW